MNFIKDVGNFPFRIYQERWNWCIPASMEAVTKYHDPQSVVTQGYLFSRILAKGESNNKLAKLGLEHIGEVFQDDPYLTWMKKPPEFKRYFTGFSNFDSAIKDFVVAHNPPIISIPTSSGQHMWVIVGHDETNFAIYDPSPPTTEDSPSTLSFQPVSKEQVMELFRTLHDDKHEYTDLLALTPKTAKS